MTRVFRPIALFLFAISYLGIALPVLGHEFWLEPEKFQPETGETVSVRFRNGQKFKGAELGYFKDSAVIFDWMQNGTRTPIMARSGDFPALQATADQDGLLVLIYQTKFNILKYTDWEKFVGFTKHKDFRGALERHAERGLPQEGFKEVYTRFCKSLIGVGTGTGQDDATGMETEFVALSNPYTDDLSNGFSVQLFYQGRPRKKAQIEVFEKTPAGKVNITYRHTDDQGKALIPVKPGHVYLLDAVVLREPSEEIAAKHDAVWESLWASMTFAIPD